MLMRVVMHAGGAAVVCPSGAGGPHIRSHAAGPGSSSSDGCSQLSCLSRYPSIQVIQHCSGNCRRSVKCAC